MNKSILVTGGAGYIGSHTILRLLECGYNVISLDNYSNSSPESLVRVENICGKKIEIIEGDVRNIDTLHLIFKKYRVSAVLHFAGLKSVSESVSMPLNYYDNNFSGTINLCRAMAQAEVFNLVFSSSATVYGVPIENPICENHPTGNPTNAYGRSKLMAEEALKDLELSDSSWSIALLRYFNPVGAHESGMIGENPNGIPNNLVPYISKVAIGELKELSVYGSDYPTLDGTGIRDYIHVMDLADGHIEALNRILITSGIHTWNLGTGIGYSVLEIIKAFQHSSNQDIPYKVTGRRSGDIAECWSNPEKALHELGWRAKRGLKDMMADTWRWQSNNPNGYSD